MSPEAIDYFKNYIPFTTMEHLHTAIRTYYAYKNFHYPALAIGFILDLVLLCSVIKWALAAELISTHWDKKDNLEPLAYQTSVAHFSFLLWAAWGCISHH